MNKIVKWLCHVFIDSSCDGLQESTNVFQSKKSPILVTLHENAQDSTKYLHSHLKTTVKLLITVFSEVTEYKTLNMFHIFTANALT